MNFKKVFQTPYAQYQRRNGQKFCVLEESKDDEDGLMYLIAFEDGTQIRAYPEEVLEASEVKRA